MPEKFESAVISLRKKFTGESYTETLFKPAYHKRIPADGVSHYMEGIWVCLLSLLGILKMMLITIFRNKSKAIKTSISRHNRSYLPNSAATKLQPFRWRRSTKK